MHLCAKKQLNMHEKLFNNNNNLLLLFLFFFRTFMLVILITDELWGRCHTYFIMKLLTLISLRPIYLLFANMLPTYSVSSVVFV